MEQLKVALAWLKQNHFWVLCGLITLIGVGSWYTASDSLAVAFKRNQQTIGAEFNSANQLKSRPFHPNDKINSAQQKENVRLSDSVRQLWSGLYDRQREEVLKWPKQLGDDFIDEVDRLSFGDPIRRGLRDRYLNYIKDYLPELPKIVQAIDIEVKSSGGRSFSGGEGEGFGGGFGGGSRRSRPTDDDELIDEDFLVRWDDQVRIKEQLDWASRPSSLRIWVTQEDLWVYVTLLRAIANVNEAAGADRYANAAVRDIYALEVGQLAAKQERGESRLFRPESAEGSSFSGSSEGGGESSYGSGGAFSEGFSGGGYGVEEPEETELLAGRYIGADGAPLPVTPGDYRFGTELKRLPVRLVLGMDQRRIPHLITELSNAPLQVELNEMRINPQSRGAGKSIGGRRSTTQDTDAVEAFPREPHIGDVVLEGVVYVYNPVDEGVLAVGGEDEI